LRGGAEKESAQCVCGTPPGCCLRNVSRAAASRFPIRYPRLIRIAALIAVVFLGLRAVVFAVEDGKMMTIP
jgi:hypothetical protein